MKTLVLIGLVVALFSGGLAHAAPGPQFDPPFASLSTRLSVTPPPLFSPTDLDLLPTQPAPLVPGSPFLSSAQAALIAKACILKGYFNNTLHVRVFSYSRPEELVNWLSPQAMFLKDLNILKYRGPAWQIHFIPPQRPGTSANVIELPGDGFDVLLAADGKELGVIEAFD